MHASSANPVDALVHEGAVNPQLSLPAVLGSDVAEIGAGVSDFAVGDEVYSTSELTEGGGAYAGYHVASAAVVAPKPSARRAWRAACPPPETAAR
ncbi:alcohol dehydrogenase catalytic domain-containing protein [Nocardia salmonicida]|uniref:alcohol dehydrogenase catalytic domain-containing protein n=1 Tax=Nocardia salmonicida TaxID=53431 RepID=UPI0035316E5B